MKNFILCGFLIHKNHKFSAINLKAHFLYFQKFYQAMHRLFIYITKYHLIEVKIVQQIGKSKLFFYNRDLQAFTNFYILRLSEGSWVCFYKTYL